MNKFVTGAVLATMTLGTVSTAAMIDDFEQKPAVSVFQKEAGATVTMEAAPEAKGISAKIAWTAVPPKGNMHVIWPDAARPIMPFEANNDAGGVMKLQIWCENPQAIRRIDARVKDARGESFTWGTDVTLEAKKWQEVTIVLRPGTETSRRSDKPGNDNGKLDGTVRLAHLGIVLKNNAEPGSIFIDEIKFEPAAAATSQPSS